ncbi:MAG TPA: DUF4287 domain-containing protein [Actinomycetota bacterium]|nr:DUF4287 domain-containing protein [Actinomycetota bacterium]
MTKQKSFKERIRARMDKTGESYATARRQLIAKSETEARKKRTPRTIRPVRKNEEAIEKNTGHGWDHWFKLLDKWGATKRKHGEIAGWLMDDQGVDGWWAQSITVAYQQERGMRAPGQRLDGTYSVTASKTINAPVAEVFKAWNNKRIRESWLGEFEVTVRTTRPAKSLTAAWGEGGRLTVSFESKGAGKSQVAMAHERIPDAQTADELKAFWRERLALLKKRLEG